MTTDYDSVDYFTDPSLVPDPHPYFDHLRAKNPVAARSTTACWPSPAGKRPTPSTRTPRTTRPASRSPGPFTPIPFVPEGDDICAQLEEHRTEIPMYEHMVTMDPPLPHRCALTAVPAADPEAAEGERGLHVAAGRPPHRRVHRRRQVRVPAAYARPFSLLVVADLLGVPEEDHEEFREAFGAQRPRNNIGGLDHEPIAANPLGVGRREVQPLHRGPPREPPRRRADRTGHREVPGRLDPRGGRRGPHRHVPVRRRPGDHRQAAQRGDAGARRPARHSAAAARRPQPHSGLHRGMPADGQPGEERVPDGAQVNDARRNRRRRQAPR